MTASGSELVINKVQYVESDFATVVDSQREFINTNYPEDFNDYVNQQMAMALVDLIAYSHHTLKWYMNRRATDLYFPTAITPNAVAKISRMLGYKPRGATAAIATIQVTLSEGPYTFPIRITKGFQFNGPNDLIFEYRGDEPIIFAAGETVKTFDVKEGYSVVENHISTGDENQIFQLVNTPATRYVAQDDIVVNVNSIPWAEYDFIPYEIVQAFETDLISIPPEVKFGDGIQGSIPPNGQAIEINYFVTKGLDGRISSQSITEPTASLVVNSTDIPLTITQPDGSFGGENPETLAEIVNNAPRFQSTQDRAITKNDYDFLSNNYENIARADAQIIRTVSSDVTVNSIIDDINNDLQQMINLVNGVSGYGLVSGETEKARVELETINTTVTGFTQVQENITGFMTEVLGNMSTTIDTVDTSMIDIINHATSGCPTVSGQIIALAQSVTGYTDDLDQGIADLETVYDSVSGLGSVSGYVETIETSVDAVSGYLYVIDELAADVEPVFEVSGLAENVSGYTQDMYDYLDTILSDGCRANTVQVSVLGKDASRKFVAPSETTITDLKDYLEERKDAVHTVVVVAGTERVVDANLTIEVLPTPEADVDDVINRIQDVLTKSDEEPLGLLVERNFNESLYKSDIHAAIQGVIEDFEVEYLNVIIDGPAEYLDSRGNLVIPTGFVIQTGTVNVNKLISVTEVN